jgi:hypothetical protein
VRPAKNSTLIAANSAQPWRGLFAIRPNVNVSAAGIAKISSIESRLVSGSGFSNGCAALALKKPPPLVPSCLIASCEAAGPIASTCVSPSSVVSCSDGEKFWITPREAKASATTRLIGSST